MRDYLRFKLALERECWIPAWQWTRKHIVIEALVVVATIIATAILDWPHIMTAIAVGGITILVLFVLTVSGFAVSAPYRLWKKQGDIEKEAESLESRVQMKQGAITSLTNLLVRGNELLTRGIKDEDEFSRWKADLEQWHLLLFPAVALLFSRAAAHSMNTFSVHGKKFPGYNDEHSRSLKFHDKRLEMLKEHINTFEGELRSLTNG